ncbi:MAG: hypothetical protein ACLTDX_21795 [[Clostridium] innocuum]
MKKATILFMVFLVIFCFAGCSSEDTSPVSSETENTAELTNGANEFEQL